MRRLVYTTKWNDLLRWILVPFLGLLFIRLDFRNDLIEPIWEQIEQALIALVKFFYL